MNPQPGRPARPDSDPRGKVAFHDTAVAPRPIDFGARLAAGDLEHEIAVVVSRLQLLEYGVELRVARSERHCGTTTDTVLDMHAANPVAVSRELIARTISK